MMGIGKYFETKVPYLSFISDNTRSVRDRAILFLYIDFRAAFTEEKKIETAQSQHNQQKKIINFRRDVSPLCTQGVLAVKRMHLIS